ncbi:MAG: amino acid permease-domain-containing protein [Monoraphidium minutum]|nr:MAG: amino acid permease-domain-containing protein [Monoraphidium minutum]
MATGAAKAAKDVVLGSAKTMAPWNWTGFDCFHNWAVSLRATPQLFAQRALFVRDAGAAEADKGDIHLERTLGWFRIGMLGVGMIVGAGIFVSTGAAAADMAGPAVIISFIISGLSAMLSALVYAEFAAQYPIAGGAFNYISLTFGELAAWLVVTTLIMEYILSQAAVARSFTAYFATLIGKPTKFFIIKYKAYDVDFLAAGLIVFLGVVLSLTTVGGATFNTVVTLLQLLVITLILILGFIKANPANLTPFLPFGIKGIFSGASFVFFSFIGFDCVSTLAEEARNPAVDMPVGIVGCIGVVTVIYFLMSFCLVLMVPYKLIDTGASFATAMTQIGFPWGSYIVGAGAVLGIVTGVLASIMGVSRIITSLGRTHLVPPLFGAVNKKFLTPLNATVFTVCISLPMAVLSDLPTLIDMVSAGTLMVFAVVALALIWHRYIDPSKAKEEWRAAEVLRPALAIFVMTLAGIGFAFAYALAPDGAPFIAGLVVTGAAAIGSAVFLHVTGKTWYNPVYKVPGFPYLPMGSFVLNCFLMASLPANAYIQLAVFFAVMIAFYLAYSIHAANYYDHALGRETGMAIRGQRAADLETAHWGAQDVGRLRDALSMRSSLTQVNPITGKTDLRREIGRFSGSVVYMPPATLP